MAALLFTHCAPGIKVKESWNQSYKQPIPLTDSVATWQEIKEGRLPEPEQLAQYRKAVRGTVVQIANNWMNESEELASIRTDAGQVPITVKSVNVRSMDLVDAAIPSEFIRVKRGVDLTAVVDGVGAPLTVRQRRSEEDKLLPAKGMWHPVTAVLNLDQPEQPVLELYDSTKPKAFANGALPLSANFSATFARDFQDRYFQALDLPALIHFEGFADRLGLQRVSAFDPEKKVCVMIHGIYSSPNTWVPTLNELYRDPFIRENYEFWTFGYPTGASIPYMAAKLRESLREMQEFRKENGAKVPEITLVGHSMGGLLSKAVTFSGGDEQWNEFFKVPIHELSVSDEAREVLREMIYYEPLPFVTRVVFCATPHQGSHLAENPIAKAVGDIIQVPAQLAIASADLLSQNSFAVTPLGMELAQGTTSLDQLRTTSRTMAKLVRRDLNPAVRYHSIIGITGKDGTPVETSSDRVVPYSSSHIEGVESEKVVYGSGHGVHRTPEGIQEIARILWETW